MNIKKLYSVFFLAILVLAVIFFWQFKKTTDIKVKKKNTYLINSQSVEITVDKTDKIFGNPGAELTIVEYNTFGCSACAEVHQAAINFVNSHPKDVRLIWKDMPQHGWFSTDYSLAHKAAFCAGKQNRFWEFLQINFAGKNKLGQIGLNQTAQDLKLNITDWENCINSDEANNRIANSLSYGKSLGIDDVPAVFLNNKKINLEDGIKLEDMLNKVIE